MDPDDTVRLLGAILPGTPSLPGAAYLLKSPENARRLLSSIGRLEHGGGIAGDLAE